MPWLEITLHCPAREESRVEQALNELGALSVTLTDAADSVNEQAILEPGVGETPLWDQVVVSALFDIDTKPELILHALEALAPMIDTASADIRRVEDQDWQRAWMDQFKPMRFGTRTFIVPWDHPIPEEADTPQAAVIRLDPGLAFGSGTHPTTSLCLQWLDAMDLRGQAVLDFGCGSGILAIAALKLGAASAVGVDNDPQALIASQDNALRNDVAARFSVHAPQDEPQHSYPVVVANILAIALISLAPLLSSRVQPGGRIALSGILKGQEDEVAQRYAEWFDELRCTFEEDWVRVDGVRRR